MKKGKAKRNGKWIDVDPSIVDWRKRRKELKAQDKDDLKARREAILAYKKAQAEGLENE